MNNIFKTAYLKQLGLIKEDISNPAVYEIQIAVNDPNQLFKRTNNMSNDSDTEYYYSIDRFMDWIEKDVAFMKKYSAKKVTSWEHENRFDINGISFGYIWSFIVSENDLKEFLSYRFGSPINNTIFFNITYGEYSVEDINNAHYTDDLVLFLKSCSNKNPAIGIHYFKIEETTKTPTITSDPDIYYKDVIDVK